MDGFHRIRHCGLLASSARKANITKIRALPRVQQHEQLAGPGPESEAAPLALREPCPCCGGPMRIIEIFHHGQNRCRTHHPESRPHDTPPVRCRRTPPAAPRRPGPNKPCASAFGPKHDSNQAKSHKLARTIVVDCPPVGHHAPLQPHPRSSRRPNPRLTFPIG